jgi:hypothetical protein
MIATDTRTVLASLALALRDLATSTADSSVINSASHYSRELEVVIPSQGEILARGIRDALSNPKSDFTDSLDGSESFRAARAAALSVAQAAVNHYIGLRRPDLATVVSAGREA